MDVGKHTSLVISDYDAPYFLGNDYYWAVNRRNALVPIYNPDGSYTEDGAAIMGRFAEGGRKKENKTTLTTQFTTKLDIIKDVLFVNGSFAYIANRNNKDGAQFPFLTVKAQKHRSCIKTLSLLHFLIIQKPQRQLSMHMLLFISCLMISTISLQW